MNPQQERTAHWVPYAQVKEQQDPLNFAFSQLKIRCVRKEVYCVSPPSLPCFLSTQYISARLRWGLISRSQGS